MMQAIDNKQCYINNSKSSFYMTNNDWSCKGVKSKQAMNTAYHPQTNGLTKRFNKILSMFVTGHHQDWDEYLLYLFMLTGQV